MKAFGLGLLLVLGTVGCETTDPATAEHWIPLLKKADQRKDAIRTLGEMKAKSAVEPLMDAYKEGRNTYDIVAALYQIQDPKATPTMLQALQDTDGKAGQLAATALLEWGAKEHADVYINVASNKAASKEQRYGAMQLLAEFPAPAAETQLLQILTGDPDLSPIIFNGLAAEALGKLGSEKAVDGLIECLWLDDHQHRNEVPRCRLALNRVGPKAAVPALINTLERKNRAVEKRARKFKFHFGGLIEAKCAELLGDMASPDATEALIATLIKDEEMPASVQQDPGKAQAFVMGTVQRVVSTANALAAIGDDRAVEPLLTVAGAKDRPLEHKLTGVQQLAFLGSPKAIPGLQKLLEHEPHPKDPVSQGFRVQIALNLANLVSGTDEKALADIEKQLNGIIEKLGGMTKDTEAEKAKAEDKFKTGYDRDIAAIAEWKSHYEKALTKLAVARECKDEPACLGKKLGEKDDAVRMMAAYRLAQVKDKAAATTELMKFVSEPDLVVRNVILFGLDRHGTAALIPELEKVRASDEEAAKKDKRLRGAVYTMDLLIAKLSHKQG